MSITQEKKLTITDLVFGLAPADNPLSLEPSEGQIQNMFSDRKKLIRAMASYSFTNMGAASEVWHIYQFNFVRDSAPESQLLIFRANGKVYKVEGGDELEVFPGYTSFTAFTSKPAVISIADRLHVSDGSQYLIWDGWDWFKAGLEPSASAPTTALVAGSLTGSYKVAVSGVHIRNGVRIHESNRSPITSTISPSAQNIRVTKPSDLPARATHWSVYISEVSTSDILRRSTTIPITTSTVDISAEPSGTSPLAPERNDSPQPSKVLAQWKNRVAMRNEQQPDQLWFTAFQEVKGRINGAPEECLPGRSSTSISDLVNSWTLPDRGERIQAAVWHENFLFVFSERNGYVVQGEGGLLDNRGLRDFFPLHQFNFGAAGPNAVISTPHGLIILSADRKLWLWEGGTDVIDIGRQIQPAIDFIDSDRLFNTEIIYYEGDGKDWLLLAQANSAFGGAYIFDFSYITNRGRGIWTRIRSATQTVLLQLSALGTFREAGRTFLLAGASAPTNGEIVYQLGTQAQPAYLEADKTAILGRTYLGTSPLSSPTASFTPATSALKNGNWLEGKYLEITQRAITPAGNFGLTTGAESVNLGTTGKTPTAIAFYEIRAFDLENMVSASTATLPPATTISKDASFRFWLRPTSTSSTGGSVFKSGAFQFLWTGTNTTVSGSANLLAVNEEVLSINLAWQEHSDLTQ